VGRRAISCSAAPFCAGVVLPRPERRVVDRFVPLAERAGSERFEQLQRLTTLWTLDRRIVCHVSSLLRFPAFLSQPIHEIAASSTPEIGFLAN
jgi:hypothetical protein